MIGHGSCIHADGDDVGGNDGFVLSSRQSISRFDSFISMVASMFGVFSIVSIVPCSSPVAKGPPQTHRFTPPTLPTQ